ncbi:uncharacterized protein LOC119289723 [Triticum dicoccoides]|uniref:uncharacterized protein LOC119289723 n=1 Tax=Triticum dicoccoides TaxID=85692 RepID=UPI00188E63C8|nr:uncharacterized protein LOC119289723 [Triticum dicoccoides]
MAMERFLMTLVFCEAPLDGCGTTGAIKQLVSGGATKPAPNKADAQKEQGLSGKSTAERRAGFELAFDGLHCFDTVVMH